MDPPTGRFGLLQPAQAPAPALPEASASSTSVTTDGRMRTPDYTLGAALATCYTPRAVSPTEDVLDFWFAEPSVDAEALQRNMRRWYGSAPDMDDKIANRFGEAVERALRGELSAWAAEPRGRLALILVLDQFPRNLFRNTARAFLGDPAAQRLALEAVDGRLDAGLTVDQRTFLVTPLLHAEDLALQERSVAEIERIVADVPEHLTPFYSMGVEQSLKYREVIRRFGRFPHRNESLSRPSTPQEIEFLKDWKHRMAPRGAPAAG